MKARAWFEAQGQSMRARGYPWHIAKRLIGLYSLPEFAQRAFSRGHLYGNMTPATATLNRDEARRET